MHTDARTTLNVCTLCPPPSLELGGGFLVAPAMGLGAKNAKRPIGAFPSGRNSDIRQFLDTNYYILSSIFSWPLAMDDIRPGNAKNQGTKPQKLLPMHWLSKEVPLKRINRDFVRVARARER